MSSQSPMPFLDRVSCMQIYYPDDDEAGEGQWWSGSVAADMLEPEEAQAAIEDPWSCEGLWERFVVHWAEPPVSLCMVYVAALWMAEVGFAPCVSMAQKHLHLQPPPTLRLERPSASLLPVCPS